MRQKLMRVGIHFGDVQFTEESGEISVPLIQYGGAFGKSGDTPIDEFDDEQESGRSINFVYERTAGGTHRILARLCNMFEQITNENVMMFALKHYDNPQCEGEKEFQDDMKRFKYIKRLLRKYTEHGVLKERLLLNT